MCEERTGLEGKYRDALTAYYNAVQNMRDIMRADFPQIRLIAMQASVACEAARLAVNEHIKKHGCTALPAQA